MRYRLVLLIFITVVVGQEYADSFLEIGVSPRSIGLGQAVTALPENSSGYLRNPASTGFIGGTEISLMYSSQFGMADFTTLTTSYQWHRNWQAGLNIVNLSVDGIPERPDIRQIIDLEERRDSIRTMVAQGFSTFKDRETGIILNLSRNFEYIIDLGWYVSPASVRQPLGMNIKLLQKQLHDLSAYGVGVDFGALFEVALSELTGYSKIGEMVFGLSVTDVLGTIIYWSSGKNDRIDPKLNFGLGYRQILTPELGDILFLYQRDNVRNQFDWGIEFDLLHRVMVRTGSFNNELQGGLGIAFPLMGKVTRMDYSFAAHNLGDCHRIGLGMVF